MMELNSLHKYNFELIAEHTRTGGIRTSSPMTLIAIRPT